MSQIIELIKVLRDRTGAGLMDCKKALLENDNDVEKAIDWLREKGIAKVAKKSSRIAAEGKTNVLASGNDAIVLEINSETDFVANSDPFADLVKYCTSAIITNKPASVEDAKKVGFDGGKSIEETFTDATIKLGEKVNVELKRQMAYLSRKEIIEESLQNYGGAILVKDLKEAFEVSNYLAPEHLEVLVENPVNTLPYIKNAGSIFLGEYSPEPLGDYMSGTNHVLPTGGTAKFYSALGVYDFVKYSSYSYYPKDVLETFKDDVQTFAKSEGLDAHANSIAVRFEEE